MTDNEFKIIALKVFCMYEGFTLDERFKVAEMLEKVENETVKD